MTPVTSAIAVGIASLAIACTVPPPVQHVDDAIEKLQGRPTGSAWSPHALTPCKQPIASSTVVPAPTPYPNLGPNPDHPGDVEDLGLVELEDGTIARHRRRVLP